MTNEQPEQWAVDWRKVAELAQDYEDPRLNMAVSALHGSIQRAFAEREAELVAALEEIKGVTERRQLPLTYQINELATAALKSREADRG